MKSKNALFTPCGLQIVADIYFYSGLQLEMIC